MTLLKWECENDDCAAVYHEGAKDCCACQGDGYIGDGERCPCPTGTDEYHRAEYASGIPLSKHWHEWQMRKTVRDLLGNEGEAATFVTWCVADFGYRLNKQELRGLVAVWRRQKLREVRA